nr:uncharacterized protein LOC115265429 [Aedes albopictus]
MLGIEAPQTVQQVLVPCRTVCKCLGLVPVFVERDLPKWKKWLNAGHLLLFMMLIARGTWNCLRRELTLAHDSGSMVVRHSNVLTIFTYYVQPLLGIITSRAVAVKTHDLISNIETIDGMFMSLGTQKSYIKERNFVVTLIVSAFVGSIISFSIYFLYDDEMDWEYFFETVHFNLLFTMTCIYGVSVSYLMHRRLYLANETISKHFPSSIPLDVGRLPEKVSSVASSEDQRETLIKIKCIVDQLNDAISLVNQCFSLQNIFPIHPTNSTRCSDRKKTREDV